MLKKVLSAISDFKKAEVEKIEEDPRNKTLIILSSAKSATA